MDEKKVLREQVTPKAILIAQTEEATYAIKSSCLGKGIIGIWKFPFRIGRESRVSAERGELVVAERHKLDDDSRPNNDLYLIDNGRLLNISREHLQVEKNENSYIVKDRQSACGTAINGDAFGGKDSGGEHRLNDGDIIRIGTGSSPYLFKFILLEDV